MKKINPNILAAVIAVVMLILWIVEICNQVHSWYPYLGVLASIILICLSLVKHKNSIKK